ncbi:MAG: ATP-binding cassette domain-containing protein [Deltaproteobacteria bacterium]|nr:ATP-binding cassette domain-containing protein [Deltaproteobacteria bacterium]
MIILREVYYKYEPEGIDALRGVSLQIKEGEHLAIIGPNGCGKTTLIRHLNALLMPAGGRVMTGGFDTKDPGHQADIRSLVGMVFQNPDHQIVGMTVEEDVAFGPENLRLPTAEIKSRVAEALARTGISELAGRNTETLSGGEKRLVAIAGVLAMRPRYIALDEPTAFLDPAAARLVLDIIDKLNSEGVGIIHITHNMTEASLTQRIVVMNEGRVYLEGTPREIFGQAEKLKEIGMQLPQITELLIHLKKAGFPVRTDIVGIEETLEQIQMLTGINKD